MSVHSVAASWYGARPRRRHWLDSERQAMRSVAGLATVAFTPAANLPRSATVAPASRRVAQPARGPRTPSGLSLLITITAGILAVVALVSVIPAVGVLALVAALVVLILASAALLAVTRRLLDDTGDEQ